jgi:membrane protein
MSEESDTKAGKNGRRKTGISTKPFLRRIPVVGSALLLYQGYSRRNGPLLSAGIAYYGLFALAPMMLLTLQLAGHIVGAYKAQRELREALEVYLGPNLADILSRVLTDLQGTASTVTTIVGLGLLLYAATRLFVRLQASFNVMWDIRTSWEKSSRRRLLSRFATLGMILIPTLLLLVSLFLSAGISWLADLVGYTGWLLNVAQALLPFLVGWFALIVIFAILPDARISWRDCWLGALCAAVLWSVGARVFGLYLSWSTSQKYAGAIGALIALIVWVDFMAIIALLGARLNRVLYDWRGKTLRPYSFAEIALPESPTTIVPEDAGRVADTDAQLNDTANPGKPKRPRRGGVDQPPAERG